MSGGYDGPMPNYRRSGDGCLFFFTCVTHDRRPLFAAPAARRMLGEAMEATRAARPWVTEGIVLLPDHLHTLWQLPDGDADYSSRIGAMKKRFTRAYLAAGGAEAEVSASQRRQRCRGVWQKRFWEHRVRDAKDFRMHLDYIHANPVRHGLASRPGDWPASSFRRYVKLGWYEPDWCGRVELPGSTKYLCVE